jgi:hypothetical protein
MLVCSSDPRHELTELGLLAQQCPHPGCGRPIEAMPLDTVHTRGVSNFPRPDPRGLRAKPLAVTALLGLLAFTAGGVAHSVLTAHGGTRSPGIAAAPVSAPTSNVAASILETKLAQSVSDRDGLAVDLNVARSALQDARSQLHDALQERDQLAGELDVASRASRAAADRLAALSAQSDQSLIAQALLLVSNLRRNFVLQTVYEDVIPKLQPDHVSAAWLDQRDAFIAKSQVIAETTFTYYVDVVGRLAQLDPASLEAASNSTKADFAAQHLMLHEEYGPIVLGHVRRLAESRNALSEEERQHWQDEVFGRSDQQTASKVSR